MSHLFGAGDVIICANRAGRRWATVALTVIASVPLLGVQCPARINCPVDVVRVGDVFEFSSLSGRNGQFIVTSDDGAVFSLFDQNGDPIVDGRGTHVAEHVSTYRHGVDEGVVQQLHLHAEAPGTVLVEFNIWPPGNDVVPGTCSFVILPAANNGNGSVGNMNANTNSASNANANANSVNRNANANRNANQNSANSNANENDNGGNACEPLADFSGDWTSDFVCTDSCGPDDSGTFMLTIIQNGDLAHYTTKHNHTFSGTVCGNVWTFGRQNDGSGETESGTLTLNADGTATRESDWTAGNCHGHCTDDFTR